MAQVTPEDLGLDPFNPQGMSEKDLLFLAAYYTKILADGGGSGGGAPTGPAGGDLAGTYPNPTVPGLANKVDITGGDISATIGVNADITTALAGYVAISGGDIAATIGINSDITTALGLRLEKEAPSDPSRTIGWDGSGNLLIAANNFSLDAGGTGNFNAAIDFNGNLVSGPYTLFNLGTGTLSADNLTIANVGSFGSISSTGSFSSDAGDFSSDGAGNVAAVSFDADLLIATTAASTLSIGDNSGDFYWDENGNLKALTFEGSGALITGIRATKFTKLTTTGNVGAGEDTLWTQSLTGNQLDTNGNSWTFELAGTIANTVNAKRLRVKFGATTIFDSGAAGIPVSTASGWVVTGKVTRSGATTQLSDMTFNGLALTGVNPVQLGTPGETLSGASTFLVTGEAVADNDITLNIGKIYYEP